MKKILNNKKIIVMSVILILVCIIVAFLTITKKNNNQENQINPIYQKIEIDGLVFDNSIIEENNGLYTFNVDVTNNNSKDYKMNYVIFEFYDKKNSMITSMVGYAKDTIKPKEKVKITSNVDVDINNAKNMKIIIK